MESDIGRHNYIELRLLDQSLQRLVALKNILICHIIIGIPYIDTLLGNIDSRFSDGLVKLLVVISIQSFPTTSRKIFIFLWPAIN